MSKNLAVSILANKSLDEELKKHGIRHKEICPLISGSDYANSVFFVKCVKDYCMLWNGKNCSFYKGTMGKIQSE